MNRQAQPSPMGRTLVQIPVRRGTVDRAVAGPNFPVDHSAIVEVVAFRTNSVVVAFSTVSDDDAKAGNRQTMAANEFPRQVTVRNLNELYVYSAVVNEGLFVTVRAR